MNTLPIAITLGDPAGIGPEVTARALSATPTLPSPLVIGPMAALSAALALIDSPLKAVPVDPNGPYQVAIGQIPLLDTGHDIPLPPIGKACAEGGAHALAALANATDLALAGRLSALVTAPLSKEAVRLAGDADFVGHTEYLAMRSGNKPVRMMMTCPKLTVVLATTHHALVDLPKLIDEETILMTLRLAHQAVKKNTGKAPRMAVCGLNPHPGEFGHEDAGEILPAIRQAQAEGMTVDGPHSADALFPRVVHGDQYDLVIAMYHDQGLVPVKLLGFDETVNITLGLPFVRTSPGHGTGFDIARQGIANGNAMAAAIFRARQLSSLPLTAKAGV